MYETAGVLSVIWKNPAATDKWINEGKLSNKTGELFHTLFNAEYKNSDIDYIYTNLCYEVHGNAQSIVPHYYDAKDENPVLTLKEELEFKFEQADGQFDRYLSYLLLKHVINNSLVELDEDYKHRVHAYFEDIKSMVREISKKNQTKNARV